MRGDEEGNPDSSLRSSRPGPTSLGLEGVPTEEVLGLALSVGRRDGVDRVVEEECFRK